jgi:O-glycosyl hydrolase
MLMVAEDQRAWLRDQLGPALAAAGLDTEVLAYDHNWDVPSYPETVYADPAAAATVAGTAWHCYGGDVAAQGAVHNSYPNEEAHHTECSGGEWQGTERAAFDATMALVINAPRYWARSVVLWNMALDDANGPTNGGCLTCRGVVTVHDTPEGATYTKNLDYYALGHASRFVVPGAVRIGSTSPAAESVQAVGYRNPDGSKVLVAHNASDGRQTFDVAWGRSSFRYALDPGAAATFVWSGRQQGSTPRFDAMAGSVDIGFSNPDGSGVLLSYGPGEARYQHTIASGQRSVSYSLPVGASVAFGASETPLPRVGWTASASSSAGGDPPSNAIDGDSSTRWSTGHGQTNGDWFTLDFGAPQTFDGLLVDSAGSTGDFARGYQVYVSSDGEHWGQSIASGPGSGQLLRVVFEPVTARYVRIVATGSSGNWWSIAEINAFTSSGSVEAPAPEVLSGVETRAFDAPDGAKGIAVYNANPEPAVFRIETWDGGALTYTLPVRAAAIFTFVGARGGQGAVPPAPTTSGIEPASGLPGATAVLTGANFGASQGASTVAFDGVPAPVASWTDTAIETAAPDGISPGPALVTVTVAGQVSNPQSFTVLSPADALPRDAWVVTASSSAAGEPPSNMIDGDIASRWSSGTGMVPGMSITIDMGATETFSQIVMDSGASTGDYARGWEIFVSDDGTTWGDPIATGVGSGRIVTASFADQTARYVRIVQTADGGGFWWSVAELYAFP